MRLFITVFLIVGLMSPTIVAGLPTGSDEIGGNTSVVVRLHERYPGPLYSLAISPEGRFLAGGDNVRVWDLRARRRVAYLHDSTGYIGSMAFSPDGLWLVTGSYDEDGVLGSAIVWNAKRWTRAATLVHGHGIGCVAFSVDGKYLAAASCSDYGENYFWAWSMPSRKLIHRRVDFARSIAFCANGQELALVEKDGIRIIDVISGRTVNRLKYGSNVSGISFPSSSRLNMVTEHTLISVDQQTGRQICKRVIPGHVEAACFLARHSIAYASGTCKQRERQKTPSNCVSIWNMDTGRCIRQISILEPATLLAVSQDGSTFASGGAVESERPPYEIASLTCWSTKLPFGKYTRPIH